MFWPMFMWTLNIFAVLFWKDTGIVVSLHLECHTTTWLSSLTRLQHSHVRQEFTHVMCCSDLEWPPDVAVETELDRPAHTHAHWERELETPTPKTLDVNSILSACLVSTCFLIILLIDKPIIINSASPFVNHILKLHHYKSTGLYETVWSQWVCADLQVTELSSSHWKQLLFRP